MRISYSALETLKQCPLKFKFQEIEKIKTPRGIEALFGSSIHSSLKFMFERGPLYPTQDQVIDFFRNIWQEKSPSVKVDEQTNDIYLNEGIAMLKSFYKSNPPWNFNTVGLESPFEVKIEDPKTKEVHTIAGRIDRIDKDIETGGFEIIDYKTSRKIPSQETVDKDLQVALYQVGLIARWPNTDQNKIKLSFFYLKHGEKISTARNKEQTEETKKYVLDKINEITERKDKDNFPAIPSALCDWCGYKKMCPMWKHLYREGREKIQNEEEMEKVLTEFFELKHKEDLLGDRLDELKALLSSFMTEQGLERVFGEQGFVTKKLQERSSYDLEKAKDVLDSINKWENILEPDEKKLTKLLPFLPSEIQEKIKELRKIKQFYTLTATKKKIKEEEEK